MVSLISTQWWTTVFYLIYSLKKRYLSYRYLWITEFSEFNKNNNFTVKLSFLFPLSLYSCHFILRATFLYVLQLRPFDSFVRFCCLWSDTHYSISLCYTCNIVQLNSFYIKFESKYFFLYIINSKTNWRISLSNIWNLWPITLKLTHAQCTFVNYCVIWSVMTYFLWAHFISGNFSKFQSCISENFIISFLKKNYISFPRLINY